MNSKKKVKIIFWLINEKQMTPDKAEQEFENFPNKCYTEWKQRSDYKLRKKTI